MRWFKPLGLLFYPVSVLGWLATLAALAFCAHIFAFVDARSHSVTDTLYAIYRSATATCSGLSNCSPALVPSAQATRAGQLCSPGSFSHTRAPASR
jgi:hypothetical protein